MSLVEVGFKALFLIQNAFCLQYVVCIRTIKKNEVDSRKLHYAANGIAHSIA